MLTTDQDVCSNPVLSTGCDVVQGTASSIDGTISGITSTIAFASDPLGYLAQKFQEGAEAMVTDVLPALNHALEPDLNTSWFIQLYAFTFAVAILVWIVQLIALFVAQSRGKVSPTQFFDVLVPRSVAFLVGCMFGPLAGMLLIEVVRALTDVVIQIAFGQSSDAVLRSFSSLISTGDASQVAGGAIVGIIIYAAMLLALLVIFCTQLVLLVTLYLAGVVFPLGWQWIVSYRHGDRATRIVKVWVGVLLTQPLVYFMFGAAVQLATAVTLQQQLPGDSQSPQTLRQLIGVGVGAAAMWLAASSPFLLAKFAPILPTDGGNFSGLPPVSSGSGSSGSLPQTTDSANPATVDGSGVSGGGSSITDALGGTAGGGAGTGGAGSGGAAGASSSGAAAGAEAGAEEAAVAGAELGPGDVVAAGIGAAAGAAAGAAEDAASEAEQTASTEAQSAGSPAPSSEAPASSGGQDINPDVDTSAGAATDALRRAGSSASGLMDDLTGTAVDAMDYQS
jgi:type IV secretion system protein TrbL